MSGRETILTMETEERYLRGNSFVVDLEWQFSDDLDLVAICVSPGGVTAELVYYGNDGKRSVAPYVHLAHQSDGDARSKHRKEHLVIANSNMHEVIYLCIWDHEGVETGRPAQFAMDSTSYGLTVTDRTNAKVQLVHSSDQQANCLLVGCIRGNKVEHISKSAIVKQKNEILPALVDMCGHKMEISV